MMTARIPRSGHALFAPSSDFCFGRESIIISLREQLNHSAAALLFGGRFSGKTTLLLRYGALCKGTGSVEEFKELEIPVYANLLRLDPEDGPRQFWRFLSRRLVETCTERIDGFRDPLGATEGSSLAQFENDYLRVQEAAGEIVLRVVFLVDEARRIFSDRFPHGVQDNLFALLYGSDSPIAGSLAMVFAGAQDLYEFFVDRTSPIGSRASQHFLSNLDEPAVGQMLGAVGPPAKAESLLELIVQETGGQPGLARMAISQHAALLACADRRAQESVLRDYLSSRLPLMQIWNASLSIDAAHVRDRLAQTRYMNRAEAARLLATHGRPGVRADRAFEELVFTGIAKRTHDGIIAVNHFYWSYHCCPVKK